ncbi:hypothetical protein FFWV33_03875 [Flavobacterium faecale]|uniref:DUF1569 domain-containing protein n=1 Tax=Flavobacterium faecale TaxID=1355330 RepID=A0A2S1LAM6_9FLAO|nr:DUF1569 domain-containing protein [Flavobacterium faecale]AWG20738.1 hypothetical protein FFWV33_03875 [Flavobacterium faecale]
MKNIFEKTVVTEIENRINQLQPVSTAKWGKMNVSQMLAHCNITYEMVFEDKHPKPKAIQKWLLKTFVKKVVVGDKPYTKNGRTAPVFVITTNKNFKLEKDRLIAHLQKTASLGASFFDGKESHSFGQLTQEEWNNMFYKHLEHHLTQFGV